MKLRNTCAVLGALFVLAPRADALLGLGSLPTAGASLDAASRDAIVYLADGSAGLRIVDVSDPANPALIPGGVLDTPDVAQGIALLLYDLKSRPLAAPLACFV